MWIRTQLFQNEPLDWITHSSWVRHRRHLRADGRYIGPVLRIVRALADPPLQRLLLRGRKAAVRLRRRHEVVAVVGIDSRDELTRVRISRHKSLHLQRHFANVQPQVGLAFVRVLPVAVKAVLRKNRPDIAIEVHRRGMHRRRNRDQEQSGWIFSHSASTRSQRAVLAANPVPPLTIPLTSAGPAQPREGCNATRMSLAPQQRQASKRHPRFFPRPSRHSNRGCPMRRKRADESGRTTNAAEPIDRIPSQEPRCIEASAM